MNRTILLLLLITVVMAFSKASALPLASITVNRQPNMLYLQALINQPPEPMELGVYKGATEPQSSLMQDALNEAAFKALMQQQTAKTAQQRFKASATTVSDIELVTRYLQQQGVHKDFAEVLMEDIKQGRFYTTITVQHALKAIIEQPSP